MCALRSSVDWWSFGILMYELVFGFTPFRGAKRDQTFENILKRKLEFPALPEVSPECKVQGTTGLNPQALNFESSGPETAQRSVEYTVECKVKVSALPEDSSACEAW